MRQQAFTVAVLAALLAATGFVAWLAWDSLGDVEISTHGYIALALGVVFTLGLGVGLMALVFISSRRGFDDEAGKE